MNKLVIFDLDGTILDTLPDIFFYVNEMLKRHNYKTRSYNEIKHFVGNGAKKLIERSLPKNTEEKVVLECLEEYNKEYTNSGSPRTKVFDGMEEVLTTLKTRGYKLAILTNKPQQTVDSVNQIYLKSFNFDIVIGQSGNIKCKPDKTITMQILSKFNVEPKNCYFIGDGETDIETSINSNTIGIACLWGNRTKEELKQAGATIFANYPKDLLNIIK